MLVVAKTLAAQTDLVRQLAARSVKREYLAVVHGRVPRDGTVRAPIGRHPRQRTRMAVVARGRDAVTHYEVLERFAGACLLRCRLETGRTHQIRVHLAALGHALIGDPSYGKRASKIPFPRQRCTRTACARSPGITAPNTLGSGRPPWMGLLATLRSEEGTT